MMKNNLKKRIVLCVLVILVVGTAVLYMWLPQKMYSKVVTNRYTLREPISDAVSNSYKQEDEAFVEQTQATATEVKATEKQGALSAANTDDEEHEMSMERNSRLMELKSLEKKDEFHGLAVGLEYTALRLEKSAHKRGIPPPIFPYREHIEEVYALLENRGYDRDELYYHYDNYLAQFNSDWLLKSKKLQEIKVLADKTEPSLFIQEVEKLFEDTTNIGLMLLRIDAYHSQEMVEELFSEIKNIIIALDNFDSKYVDKRAILYSILRSATIFAYSPEVTSDDTTQRRPTIRPKRVKFAHPEFLAALEMDGKL